jgi:monoamine oxidase
MSSRPSFPLLPQTISSFSIAGPLEENKPSDTCSLLSFFASSTMAVSAPPPLDLFDGRKGTSAPFKADYVSSLISTVLKVEIDQILRLKALQDHDPNVKQDKTLVDNLVAALKEERVHKRFPAEKFGKNEPSNPKIGIVGGGIAGLYTAYILKSLGIDYEILEANPDRMGGRIYTHHFSTDIAHDYYDIGAMRFPDSPIMARTFDLFRRLKMGEPGKLPEKGNVLMPYYMIGRNCPTRYNDITACLGQNEGERSIDKDGIETQKAPDPVTQTADDPFKVSTANGGTVPATRVSHEVASEILNDAYERFRQKIKAAQILTEQAKAAKSQEQDAKKKAEQDANSAKSEEQHAKSTESKEQHAKKKAELDAKEKVANEARQRAYEYLMRHDKFSLRDYLQNVEGYDPETVHWLETTDSASGWYDMAFTENVLESLAFAYSDASNQNKDEDEKPTKWWCIEGGTEIMIKRLLQTLDKGTIFPGKVVKRMVLKKAVKNGELPQHNVAVTMRDYHTQVEETRDYSAVINTTTLGALQKIDLTGMELPYGMKSAIRVLRYDTSTKVGIKFKEMWWKGKGFDITLGGVAKTDLPIRVCVYPSYNIGDTGSGVLLASYTWGQDSERIAAHVSTNSPDNDKGLKELMIYNLARLHTVNRDGESKQAYEKRFQENTQIISDNWVTHHAYDWSKDEFSCGAFALFSPGQFSTLIPQLLRPASDGRFVIVGEHASANHAWIVGALDSAVRGLKQILTRLNLTKELDDMIKEFTDVDELKQEQVAKQVIISMLTEDQMSDLRLGRPIQAVAQIQQT